MYATYHAINGALGQNGEETMAEYARRLEGTTRTTTAPAEDDEATAARNRRAWVQQLAAAGATIA